MAKFTISEVAHRVNISRDAVRNAEKRGLIVSIRDANGWRIFDESAVEILHKFYRRSDGAPGVQGCSSAA